MTCRVTPQTAPSASWSRSTTSACSTTSMPGSSCTACSAAMRAREISAPVASPPAWAIRSRWCPPSRVSEISPSGVAVELGAERDELADRVGALGDERPDRRRVADADARPPGCRRRCSSGVSAGSGPRRCRPAPTAVDPSASTVLVTSRTRSTRWRSRSAAVSPAMPEPTTMTSAAMVQPGSGAASRRGDGQRRHRSRWSRSCRPARRRPRARRRRAHSTGMLSIRRVVPTRPATASRASPRYHSGTSSQGRRVDEDEVVDQRQRLPRRAPARAAPADGRRALDARPRRRPRSARDRPAPSRGRRVGEVGVAAAAGPGRPARAPWAPRRPRRGSRGRATIRRMSSSCWASFWPK